MQDKSKLGKRYSCFQCELKFYDLNRPEPLCPKCGADQRENPNPDPREAILSRFRSKVGGKTASHDDFEADEEADEDVELDGEELDEEDDDAEGEEAGPAGDEED